MIINHNIAALNTLNQMNKNSEATQKSLQKLSSGLRINSAADDAAGLAISEKMKGQIRGLDMATKNAQDGTSLIQTAEGALSETQSILQRMRELAVQSGNDTNTDQDRKNLQDEMSQLTTEIDRISSTTQFNTKNLLDGSMGSAVNTAVANINTSAALKDAGNSNAAITATTYLSDLEDSNGNSLGIATGDTIDVSYVINGTTKTDTIAVTAGTTTVAGLYGQPNLTADANGAITSGSIGITAKTAGFSSAINGLTLTVKDSAGNTKTAATNTLSSFAETKAAADVRTDGSATFQIGANAGQNMQLSINNMGASALGVKGLQISTQSQSDVALKAIDTAIQKVSAERSKLGATQNRLEHTINNLSTSSENLSSAQSRIADVDMAKEMSNFTKNNILNQAAQAMLAQANQLPQGVLQLLR